MSKVQVGKVYRVNPKFRKECGCFSGYDNARKIKITDIRGLELHYDILEVVK